MNEAKRSTCEICGTTNGPDKSLELAKKLQREIDRRDRLYASPTKRKKNKKEGKGLEAFFKKR